MDGDRDPIVTEDAAGDSSREMVFIGGQSCSLAGARDRQAFCWLDFDLDIEREHERGARQSQDRDSPPKRDSALASPRLNTGEAKAMTSPGRA